MFDSRLYPAFGGPDSTRGNTGPFWVGSGLAILSAIVTFFFIRTLTVDGMANEDRKFRAYLEAHGWDTSQMGDGSVSVGTASDYDEGASYEKDVKQTA